MPMRHECGTCLDFSNQGKPSRQPTTVHHAKHLSVAISVEFLMATFHMQARAKGIRCGDGVGDAGRAAIPWLKERGALSMEEARQRCLGLRVLPMRTDRYREVHCSPE